MEKTLMGRRAIVTGASRGIGRQIASEFAGRGALVLVNYIDASEKPDADSLLEEIASTGGTACGVKADVRAAIEVDQMMAQAVEFMGGIDILVNNAGVCPWHEFLTMPIESWQLVQSVNHLGTFLCSQRVANQMVRQGSGGTIISIGSVGAYTGGAKQSHYNASKAAVGALMRCLAVALGPHQIRCNSILPGCIRTAMNAKELTDQEVLLDIQRRTPLGRLGSPEDVVGAAVFFASDLSRFCTGAELCIDGGLSVNV